MAEHSFTETVPHRLGKEAARERLEAGLPKLLQMLPGGNVRHHWTGDTMFLDVRALGQGCQAAIEVFDDHVRLDVTLSGLLATMGSKLSALFRRGTSELLEDKR